MSSKAADVLSGGLPPRKFCVGMSPLARSLLPRRSLGLFRRASALGCARQRCSGSLEYASSCYLPTTWLDLPLVAKREHNHDSTLYSFGLPEGDHTPTHTPTRTPTHTPIHAPIHTPIHAPAHAPIHAPARSRRSCGSCRSSRSSPPFLAAAARLLPQQPAFPCRVSGQALNLPTCACLLLRVPGTPDDAVRPYTPISEEARRGSFDLLVKRYAG